MSALMMSIITRLQFNTTHYVPDLWHTSGFTVFTPKGYMYPQLVTTATLCLCWVNYAGTWLCVSCYSCWSRWFRRWEAS